MGMKGSEELYEWKGNNGLGECDPDYTPGNIGLEL